MPRPAFIEDEPRNDQSPYVSMRSHGFTERAKDFDFHNNTLISGSTPCAAFTWICIVLVILWLSYLTRTHNTPTERPNESPKHWTHNNHNTQTPDRDVHQNTQAPEQARPDTRPKHSTNKMPTRPVTNNQLPTQIAKPDTQ